MRGLAAALLLCLSFALGQGLEVHFIDVGQGDAVLIRSSSGQNVLYDGGRSSDTVLTHLTGIGVEALDLVIASHADADHIGGLRQVVLHYRPRYFLDNALVHTTQTYRQLLAAVAAAGSQYLEPSSRRIRLGEVTLQVLPPPGDPQLGQNDNSVGLLVEYGEFRLGLTGDAGTRQFEWWSRNHPELLAQVTVYKASHHGSSNGDSAASMRAFQPEVVVISVGSDNGYGHPTLEASRLYHSASGRVLRTDLQGSVLVLVSEDGGYEVIAEREESLPETLLLALAQPARSETPPTGTVFVECVLFDPDGRDDGREVVTLRALEAIDVSGWVLQDEAGHSFQLPRVSIPAGEGLNIPNSGRPLWNNDGDTAYLYDRSGDLIDSFSYSGSGTKACR